MSFDMEKIVAKAETVRSLQHELAVAVRERNELFEQALAAGVGQVKIAAAAEVSQATVSRVDRDRDRANDRMAAAL